MLKSTLRIFHDYFHRLRFTTKLIIEIQFCMKTNHKKFMMYFSSTGHHITSHGVKFEIKIPLVRGEIERRNPSRG